MSSTRQSYYWMVLWKLFTLSFTPDLAAFRSKLMVWVNQSISMDGKMQYTHTNHITPYSSISFGLFHSTYPYHTSCLFNLTVWTFKSACIKHNTLYRWKKSSGMSLHDIRLYQAHYVVGALNWNRQIIAKQWIVMEQVISSSPLLWGTELPALDLL